MPSLVPHLLPHRAPQPDRRYDASDAWVAELATAAAVLVRQALAEAEDAAALLEALHRRVAWEGPAAREFRNRADALSAAGVASAEGLRDVLDDVLALRFQVRTLSQGEAYG